MNIMDFGKYAKAAMRSISYTSCKKYYDKLYTSMLLDLDINPNEKVEGEDEWIKNWDGLKIVPNPIYYRLFRHYCGNKKGICPEDICRQVIEPCLNPQRYRGFYEDKNSWDAIHADSPFPPTTVRCIDGLFYDKDYKRIVGVDDKKFYAILSEAGGGKFFVKPTRDSNSSRGTSSINFDNGKWYLGKERNHDLTINDIIALSGRNFIIQPFQKQHAEMSKFCSTSINPLRIITYKSVTDDKVHVMRGAMIRIGAQGEENDGTHGNGKYVGINQDGTLKHDVLDYLGHVTHEFNGIDFRNDYTIPGWDKACKVVTHIAEQVIHHRLLAFDVMIDEKGEPIVFEYNINSFSIWLPQFVGELSFDEYTDEVIEYCKKNVDIVKRQFLY